MGMSFAPSPMATAMPSSPRKRWARSPKYAAFAVASTIGPLIRPVRWPSTISSTFFTDRLRERLSIDYTLSNVLEIVDGHLTGRISGPIIDAAAKAAYFGDLADRLRGDNGIAIAIGDGANDIPMLARADLSVAYRAKPRVRAAAVHAIDHSGLDAVLNLFA